MQHRAIPSSEKSSSTASSVSSDVIPGQVVEWNKTEAAFPLLCLHELFEGQVERTPQAIAVMSQQTSLSYEQLNQQANRLARHLRKALSLDPETGPKTTYAVGAEPRVALFVGHTSPLVLVGFWGILKAGCAVVLMDTAASKERITSILAEAQPQLILVQAELLARLPQHEARVVCLDAEGEVLAQERSENVVNSMTLSNVAYLISTSGTTGVPKVVEIAHQGLSNLHVAQMRAFGVRPADRVLQFSPMSFDAALWEIMMAHLVGATLCLGTEEELEAGSHLAQFMRRARITVATLTPSVLTIMPPSEALPDLRILISVGEACTAAVVARWAPGRAFYNALGHAEGTICLTIGQCEANGRPPSVGKVIQNNRIYVVTQGRLANVGEEGELYIAGVGLAVGYTQEALTQARFTPPSIEGIPETRWYRTGDIVSWLPDGALMYVRRIAGEYVKVRGVRVEPKEIEGILMQDAAVLSCAVVDRPHAKGLTELVAFVVLMQDCEPTTTLPLLWDRLAARLPASMIPHVIVPLDAMPVTAHGKLDTGALKAWKLPMTATPDQAYVAPQTSLEQQLVEHFAGFLHIDPGELSIDTRLTTLRRDSFSVAHFAAAIKEASGVYISELSIARKPTIRHIAAEIERRQAQQKRSA
jgi:amino acid adenylation domain-containing protein